MVQFAFQTGPLKLLTALGAVPSPRIAKHGNSYLVDKIHHWAKMRFCNIVIQHLKPWHKYCDEDYLSDWDTDDENSKAPQSKKRKHGIDDKGDVSEVTEMV